MHITIRCEHLQLGQLPKSKEERDSLPGKAPSPGFSLPPTCKEDKGGL